MEIFRQQRSKSTNNDLWPQVYGIYFPNISHERAFCEVQMVYFVADKDEWYQSGVRWMHENVLVVKGLKPSALAEIQLVCQQAMSHFQVAVCSSHE